MFRNISLRYILLVLAIVISSALIAQDNPSMADRHIQQAQQMLDEQAVQDDRERTAPAKVSPKHSRNSVRTGNKLYHNDDFLESEVEYRRALDADPESAIATYNLGNALYRQGHYEEAAEAFAQASNMTDDKELRSRAFHNLGNAAMLMEDIPQAIEAYKNSLRLNPGDDETRYNLSLAQKMLQEQSSQQEEQQQEEQQQEEQQQQQQPQSPPQQPEQPEQPQEGNQMMNGMSRENAQQIFDALQQRERDAQERVQQYIMQQQGARRVEKQW